MISNHYTLSQCENDCQVTWHVTLHKMCVFQRVQNESQDWRMVPCGTMDGVR